MSSGCGQWPEAASSSDGRGLKATQPRRLLLTALSNCTSSKALESSHVAVTLRTCGRPEISPIGQLNYSKETTVLGQLGQFDIQSASGRVDSARSIVLAEAKGAISPIADIAIFR